MFSKVAISKASIIKITLFTIVILGFIMFLYLFNQGDRVQLINKEGTSFEKAIVEEVIKDNIQEDGSRTGTQILRIKILSGDMKGKKFEATSSSGNLYGAACKENMKVIVNISTSSDNFVVTVYSYYRAPIIYAFVALFLLLLWIIGGKKGFKSVIALIFTFICIIFLFIPMLYKGYSPFLSAVIIGILITIVTMYLIGGFSSKTLASILGTLIGVIIAGGSAYLFGYISRISGYNVSQVEELVYVSNQTNLKIGGILFAGILIASLGAVMDVSISIASTIQEIHLNSPSLKRRELFYSGINVGRDMMGTMSNTLLLAFTGGAINTLILAYAYSMEYNQMINMYSIGIEIMQGISGSIGIIATVPFVSVITVGLLTFDKEEIFTYFKAIKKKRKLLINCILVTTFLTSTIYIGYKCFQYLKDNYNYSKVKVYEPSINNMVEVTTKKEIIKGQQEDISSNIEDINSLNKQQSIGSYNEEKLKEINPDYNFWLKIGDSDISYPVVQGKDNDWYLTTDFYREKSEAGAIFVDYRNDIDNDKNIILYGHNMKDGTMFNKINIFKNKDEFNNGTIKVIKKGKEYVYEVFSVFVEKDDYNVFKNNFPSEEQYKDYIKYIKEKSIYNKNIGENNNQIITLYTCSYEFKNARTIVYGILKE